MMKYNFEQLNFAFKLDKWIAFNFGYETSKISQVDDQGSFSFRATQFLVQNFSICRFV